MSLSTIKRILKTLGKIWKRIRKSLRSKRDQKAFNKAKKELERLLVMHQRGDLDLYYFDQSGFTLEPSVPYAWQDKGNTIEVPSAKSRRFNVLGFLSPAMDFKSVVFDGKIDSIAVIATIDHFIKFKRSNKPMIIVMDNAPMHHSEEFEERIDYWKKRGVELYFIPPYSPELNKIEILWRFIKNHWLPFSSYENLKSLKENLFDVLASIGTKYQITFG